MGEGAPGAAPGLLGEAAPARHLLPEDSLGQAAETSPVTPSSRGRQCLGSGQSRPWNWTVQE